MTPMLKTLGLIVLAATAVAAAAASPATAHDRERAGARIGATALVNEAAARLDVPAATLRSAIVRAANARIDAAVAAGKLDAERAARLKARLDDHVRLAIRISRTGAVAANLGITTTQLDNAFREARRALIRAKIDAAVAAGKLSAERAAELKARLATARLPGYKPNRHAHRR